MLSLMDKTDRLIEQSERLAAQIDALQQTVRQLQADLNMHLLALGQHLQRASKKPTPVALRALSTQERRSTPRRKGNPISVSISNGDRGLDPFQGWVVDRSAGGLRQQFSTPENIALSQFALGLFRRLGSEFGADADVSFREQGYLIMASAAGQAQLAENVALQQSMRADIALLGPTELAAHFPWISTDGIAAAGFGQSGEGWFDPPSLAALMRKAAAANGIAVVNDERGRLDTGGTADLRNNLESVFLPTGTSGSYSVTVRATNIAGDGVPGNADTTDQDFALLVYNGTTGAPPPDFTLAATPSSNAVTAGGSANYTVSNTALNGFSGSVTLSASPAIGGVSYSFTPNPQAANGSSTFTATTTAGATTGTHSITITGTSGSLVHTANVSLTINAAPVPDFTLVPSRRAE